MKEQLIKGLNLVLVANVFFVLFSFFWLVVAVLGHSFKLNLGLDLWYKLWEPVFTPAIGILMGGAILSWAIGKINQLFFSPKSD
ncbi:MAG TPA: hypothetical protein V6D21_14885 [Candidatus Obscuribacterales bacterium]